MLLFFSIFLLPLYAEEKQQTFKALNQIPEGFEDIGSQPVQVLSPVYFLSKKTTQTMVKYIPIKNTLIILNPKALVDQLYNIKNKQVVLQALKGELPTNSDKVCQKEKAKGCGVIFPNIAGVIYNPVNYKLSVFINQNYLVGSQTDILSDLDESDVGFSYLQSLQGSAIGNSNETETNLVGVNNYNLLSQSLIGYKNTYAYAEINASKTNELQSVQFTRLNVNTNKWHKEITAGFLQTVGTNALVSQQIVGAAIRPNYNTYVGFQSLQSTPVEVFLAIPSTVAIYKSGRIIYSGSFQAGYQSVPTQTFPSGSYSILVQIIGENGQESIQEQFFVKNPRLPSFGYPNYEIAVGFINGQGITQGVFPNVGNNPYISLFRDKRLSNDFALQGQVEGTERLFVGSLGTTYITELADFSIEGILDTSGGYGGSVGLNLGYERLSGIITARHIDSDYYQELIDLQGELNSTDFFPYGFAADQIIMSSFYNFSWGNIGFTLNYFGNKFNGSPNNYAYGPNMTINTGWIERGLCQLKFSAIQSENDRQLLATLQINFGIDDWNFFVSPGLEYQENSENSLQENINLSASRNIPSDTGDTIIQGGVSRQSDINSVNAQVLSNYDLGQASFSARYNNGSNGNHNMQYTANVQSRMAYSDRNFDFGGYKYGLSGIIVEIKSTNQDQQGFFEVVANNRSIGKIQINDRKTFILQPYQTYAFQIKPLSGSISSYDNSVKYATIYPGNVAYKEWRIEEKYILITEVDDDSGQPIPYGTIEDNTNYAQTTEYGFLQMEITESQKSIKIKKNDGQVCIINLEDYHLAYESSIIDIPNVICRKNN